MTEEEWDNATRCGWMIQALMRHEKNFRRRSRLFRELTVTALRELIPFAPSFGFQFAIETAEKRHAGALPRRELEEAILDVTTGYGPPLSQTVDIRILVMDSLWVLNHDHAHVGLTDTIGRLSHVMDVVRLTVPGIAEWTASENEVESRYAVLLREFFGNPFRPVAFDPAWRTSTAIGLASTMYESRNFNAMPILADALQDAGCENEHILTHCRDEQQVHVRGCWVVDLVLEKS
jgi:hypothetical protein